MGLVMRLRCGVGFNHVLQTDYRMCQWTFWKSVKEDAKLCNLVAYFL